MAALIKRLAKGKAACIAYAVGLIYVGERCTPIDHLTTKGKNVWNSTCDSLNYLKTKGKNKWNGICDSLRFSVQPIEKNVSDKKAQTTVNPAISAPKKPTLPAPKKPMSTTLPAQTPPVQKSSPTVIENILGAIVRFFA